ncbi:HPr family phosphocarrier protein [Anaerosporobacter faecicola]|uniref:HPr family phosphocarrier protein n=1 Tax=Anaerosporobacter faecicola TaxID=2718714 RepID=UPI00143C3FC0|nr:HPr family phosphocarrier protein [Anaerosporobacter faecicola]
MVSKQFTIKNEQGLHMRPAGVVTKEMMKFNSDVTIVVNGATINAKSIMNVMAACIKFGTEIEVQCNGEDEDAALAKFEELYSNGFGE